MKNTIYLMLLLSCFFCNIIKGEGAEVAGLRMQTQEIAGERFQGESFNDFVIKFISAVQAGESIEEYVHPQIKVYTTMQPGVSCVCSRSENPEIIIEQKITAGNIYSGLPECGFDGCIGAEDGLYNVQITMDELPDFVTYNENAELESVVIEIPPNVNYNKIIKAMIVTDEIPMPTLYFISIDSKWYIICQDRCDDSA